MDRGIKYIHGLTPMQEGMLFHKLAEENSTSYHNQNAVWLDEELNVELFKLALDLISFKHEALGVAIVITKTTGVPRQVFFKNREIECEYVISEAEDTKASVENAKREDIVRGFDFQNDSLIRAKIIYFAKINKYFLLFSHHHIIMDGWCMSFVFGDLMRYYSMLVKGMDYDELKKLVSDEKNASSKYVEYLKWLDTQNKTEGLAYWEELLEGYDGIAEITPAMRPEVSENTAEKVDIQFSEAEVHKIKQAAKECNVSVNTLFEAVWGIILQKYNYTNDVVFGKVVSGRNVPIAGIENTVGLFINTIPCRVTCDSDMTVSELLAKLKKQAALGNSYDFCPLFEIQNLTKQRSNLIKTLIVFENSDNFGDINVNEESTRAETNYDLNFGVYIDEGKITIRLLYNPNRYPENDMKYILQHIKTVTMSVISKPYQKVGEIEAVTESEKRIIFGEFNNTIVEYPREKTVIELFEEQVEKTPGDIAVVFEEEQITYEELNNRANQLAKRLRKIGVRPEDKVAIISERSMEAVIGIVAIIKSGGAYVPVDAAYPEPRKQYVLQDSKPAVVLVYGCNVTTDIPTINLADKDIWEGICDNPKRVNSPHNLAYIIYTSGTSGNPKGVMVEHNSIVKLVKNINYVELNENTAILQTGQLAFDASTFEIWGALLNGGKINLIRETTLLNTGLLKAYIIKQKINTLFITTALFNQLVSEDYTIFDPLIFLLFGGEKTSEEHVRILRSKNKTLDLKNVYGPTEGTTFSTYYNININNNNKKTPIGKPISNTQTYIMSDMCLCGVGVPGELCISGDGIARGYLNQPELTKDKFVSNPFGKGKLYKTGDLARWLPDGNIEYLGRIDTQVKIRGFRIELGEIESVIRKIDFVKNAVVAARSEGSGELAIYSYIISDKRVSVSEIKDMLSKVLPFYMIPKYIMFIDTIPVTKNGKIDFKALPEIEAKSEKEYVAPGNDVETTMVNVFEEILGIEKVGILDNFFELGGDSIKAIRIVSKMRVSGYEVSVKDIMQYQTVEKIARMVTNSINNEYEQGEVTGVVSNTPILETFSGMQLVKPWHYNQAVIIHIGTTNEVLIKRVIEKITRHHDILRAVWKNEQLEILLYSVNRGYEFSKFDLTNHDDVTSEIERICREQQSSIDLENGPLMKTVLFITKEGGYLFICLHHLVVDGVSWRILMDDLNTAFMQISTNKEISLPAKTASFKEWSEALGEYRYSKEIQNERKYWENVVSDMDDKCLGANESCGSGTVDDIKVEVDEALTELLLRRTSSAYNTEISDILLSTLVQTFGSMFETDKLVVGLEGHGREEIHKKIDIDRTVGWFTSIYPIVLRYFEDTEQNIIQTKDYLRRIPNKGFGYGFIRKELENKPINLVFNYLGEMDSEKFAGDSLSPFTTGISVAKENASFKLAIDCIIIAGKLNITISYDTGYYCCEVVQEIANNYVKNLQQNVQHCITQDKCIKTLSDFSEKNLSSADKSEINNSYPDSHIADIYSLTSLQEGMLYHNIINSESTNYVIQYVYNIGKKMDESILRKALVLLSQRHSILRTVFMYDRLSQPFQIVLTDREIELEVIDLSSRDISVIDQSVQDIIKKDVKRGFNLQDDVLLRIKLLKINEFSYKMIFTIHHIIVDGWCISVLLGDILRYYTSILENESEEELRKMMQNEAQLTAGYHEYVNWVLQQDKESGLNYWDKLLNGYDDTAQITAVEKPDSFEAQMERVVSYLSEECSLKVSQLSAELHVTVNSIIETVWGIVLQSYNHSRDVVFGKVVSGRNADIHGIESMVGLFINTIPIRVTSEEGLTAADLIKKVQLQGDESSSFDYCALADIQSRVKQGRELIKTILVFENFYTDTKIMEEGRKKELLPEIESYREQLNYPISIIVSMETNRLEISCLYNPNEFAEAEIKLLLERICVVFNQIAENPFVNICNIETITESEKNSILKEFNATDREFPKDKVLMELFELQAEEHPDEIAVVFEDQKVTYEELNKAANSLAWKLRSKGVGPDDFVVIVAINSIEMLIGIIGILKSGGAYVPIDPDYPKERIEFILNDCKPKAIMTYGADISDRFWSEYVIELDYASLLTGDRNTNPKIISRPSNLAYCLYTSGTTGKPKGVLIEQRSVVNYVNNNSLSPMFVVFENGYKKIVSITNYTFDIFATETILSLINGMTIYMANEEEKRIAVPFTQLCEKHNIEVMQTTPSKIKAFLSNPISNNAFKKMKCIILCGEKIECSLVEKLSSITDAKIINGYGPTEATVLTTKYIINPKERYDSVSIGGPLANIKVYIMNGHKLCGIGIPGELCVAGAALARGYLNRAELTALKFVENPFGAGRLYCTGDLVKWRSDGNIVYCGRMDEQIKLNGLRIELGEIDSTIRNIDFIKDCAVITRTDINGDMSICAYVVSDIEVSIQQVRSILREKLPSYMIPHYIQQIDEIPVNSSGKLNKRELPEITVKTVTEYMPPRNEAEEQLCSALCGVLNIKQIGINDNFFELGGNSLKAIRLISLMSEKGYKISLQEIMKSQSVAAICQSTAFNNNNFGRQYIDRFYSGSDEFSGEKTCEGTDSQKEILDNYIAKAESEFERYDNEIIKGAKYSDYPICGIQYFSYLMGVKCFAMQIPFYEDIDIERFGDSWAKIQETFDVLKSSLILNQHDKVIRIYDAGASKIPYVDISEMNDHNKKKFIDDILNVINYYQDDSYYTDKNLASKVMLIKFADNAFSLFITCSHLISDGFSIEIFKNRFLSIYYDRHYENVKLPYSDYSGLLSNKDNTATEDVIIRKLELKEYCNAFIAFKDKYTDRKYTQYAYQFEADDRWAKLTEAERLEISQKMFTNSLHYTFTDADIPVCLLHMRRKNKKMDLFKYVGEFLDLIPIVLSADYKGTLEELIEKKLPFVEENNLYFSSLFYPDGEKEYPKINNLFLKCFENFDKKAMEQMLVYNNTGVLGSLDNIVGKQVAYHAANIMDIEVNQNGFKMNLLVECDRFDDTRTFLNNCLNELLDISEQEEKKGDIL